MMLRKDLRVGKGETFDLNLRYKADDGTYIDLTDHSVEFTLRERLTGYPIADALATTSENGHIDIKVPDEETATWPAGKHAYLVELTFPGGDERWLLHGVLEVVSGVDL